MENNHIWNYIRISELPVGTKLYRHVNIPINKCILGMTKNKRTNGRCNFNHNIYYCAISPNAIKIERGNNLKGSLIISEVVEPIYIGQVINEDIHLFLRGRVDGEKETLVHTNILGPLGKDVLTTYNLTNFITDCVLKYAPDGLRYSSVNGIDTIIGKNMFQLTEDTGWGNIALTENGYKKIKEIGIVDASKY